MTASWGGEGLSEEKQGGDEYELLNHLRIVRKV
ncbi:MAG TPA: Imm32 family immunity protein [Candidatus Methylomirabilis sp.]